MTVVTPASIFFINGHQCCLACCSLLCTKCHRKSKYPGYYIECCIQYGIVDTNLYSSFNLCFFTCICFCLRTFSRYQSQISSQLGHSRIVDK